MEITIVAATVSMKSILNTTHPIVFNSEVNTFLDFTKTHYSKRTHESQKLVEVNPIVRAHLKCDCVTGSIVNGNIDLIAFSFNLDSPLGYKK